MKKAVTILGINTLIIICSTTAIILDVLHFDLYIFIMAYAILFWVVALVEIIRLFLINYGNQARKKRLSKLYRNKGI